MKNKILKQFDLLLHKVVQQHKNPINQVIKHPLWNIKKKNCIICMNLELLDLNRPKKGKMNNISIEENIATTPPNLSGIALKIA